MTVNGTTTTINSNTVTINDLQINMANNAANSTEANNGGIGVGPVGAEYATLLYNTASNVWISSLGISAVGNIKTGAGITATGNATGGNLLTGGQISATGNITTAGYFVGTFAGNISGNLTVPGSNTQVIYNNSGNAAASAGFTFDSASNAMVVAGNITGANLTVGSGSNGVVTGANIITANTIVASVTLSSNGNVYGNAFIASGSGGGISASGNIIGGNILTAGLMSSTGNITGSSMLTAGLMSSTGNAIHGNITTAGLISATSTITSAANITGGNILTAGLISSSGTVTGTSHLGAVVSVTGNITGGNLSVGTGTVTVGNIVNSNANTVGNIGSSSNYFNTVFAQTTTALYGDLAENYLADAEYAPGTVLSFGGSQELTISSRDADPLIAGIVSTKPAYHMNAGLSGEHVVTLALVGRVPSSVQGKVTAGDMMVSAGNGRARAESNPKIGTVIGKAITSFDGDVGIIEILVGRI